MTNAERKAKRAAYMKKYNANKKKGKTSGSTKSSSKSSTVKHNHRLGGTGAKYLRLMAVAMALNLQKLKVEIPAHLKGDFEALLAPPPPPEVKEEPAAPVLDDKAKLSLIEEFASKLGINLKGSPTQAALPGLEVTPVVTKEVTPQAAAGEKK